MSLPSIGNIVRKLQSLKRDETLINLDIYELQHRLSLLKYQQIQQNEPEKKRIQTRSGDPFRSELQQSFSQFDIQNKQLEQKKNIILAEQKQILGSLPPPWQLYLNPPPNVDLGKVYSHTVLKYVALETAINSTKEKKETLEYLRRDNLRNVETLTPLYQKLAKIQTEMDENTLPNEDTYEYRTMSLRRKERKKEKLGVLSRQKNEIELKTEEIELEASLYVRGLFANYFPPFEQLSAIYFWWSYQGHFYKHSFTVNLINSPIMWLGLSYILFNGSLLAIVIRTKSVETPETIYPVQKGILFEADFTNIPITNVAILERLIKLPNELSQPDLYSMLSNLTDDNEEYSADYYSIWYNNVDKRELGSIKYTEPDFTKFPNGVYPNSVIQIKDDDIFEYIDFFKKTGSNNIVMIAYSKSVDDIHNNYIFLKFPLFNDPVDLWNMNTNNNEITSDTSTAEAVTKANFVNAVQLTTNFFVMWIKTWLITPSLWMPTVVYKRDNIVSYQGKNYVCIISANTTSVNEIPGQTATNKSWQIRLPALNEFELIPAFMSLDETAIHVNIVKPRLTTLSSPNWPCLSFSVYPPDNKDLNELSEGQIKSASDFKTLLMSGIDMGISQQRSYWRAEAHYVNATGGCEILIQRSGISRGGVMVSIAKQLTNIFNADYMLLEDAASIKCSLLSNRIVYLKTSNVLKEGIPWYSRFGLIPPSTSTRAIAFINNVLAKMPWNKLRELMLTILYINDGRSPIIQSIEAITCATNPVNCAGENQNCINDSLLKNTSETVLKKMCVNYSIFFDFFTDRENISLFLKMLKLQKEYTVDEIRQYFYNNIFMVWIRRWSTLQKPKPIISGGSRFYF